MFNYSFRNRKQFQIIFQILLFIFCFESIIAQESVTHNLYNRGYYTLSIEHLQKELVNTKKEREKIDIYYNIAMSCYGMYYVEEYKKYIDTAYHIASTQNDFSYVDKVAYGIAMIRYFNFEIKPARSLEIYDTIFPLFHKKDPQRTSPLWISLYQNIATTRRNTGDEYKLMNAEFDSAYYLLQKHKLLNTIHEVNYCKSRGNINLDRVSQTSNPMFFEKAITLYERGLNILQKKEIQNYPMRISLQSLEGLVSYMGAKFNQSKEYFDKAYASILIAKKERYNAHDIKSCYLNALNWGNFTTSVIYQECKDVDLIKKSLKRLKRSLEIFKSFSVQNKDVDIAIFTDIYNYSPVNSIISCYYHLYEKTKNNRYIDSAFYFSEMNKAQWDDFTLSFDQLKRKRESSVEKGNIIIQYGEFGFYHHTYLYAIVFSKKGSYFVNLGKQSEINEIKLDLNNWRYYEFANSSYKMYAKIFKPLEKYLHKKPHKLIINTSRLFVNVSIESLITDLKKSISYKSFLFNKYPLYIQPSFRSYKLTENPNSINKVCLINPKYNKHLKAQIRFSGKAFKTFINEKEMNLVPLNSKNKDLIFVAAHCYPGNHRVDNAYIDMGEKSLSIKDVCKMKLHSNLAILALCNGGFGQNVSGSSFSLASSFLMSGVQSCLYSIWKLDDKIGSEIITSFLHKLEKGEQKDEALREAKKEYLERVTAEEGLNPIYWAGLNVIGNVAPIKIQESNTSYWKVGILFLLLFFLLIIVKKLRL